MESVPSLISRNGFTFRYAAFSLSALCSYTSESFADTLNSVQPALNGATGLVPFYLLLDLTIAIQVTDKIKFQVNASNIGNKHYFTKRPQFYPGPGIWPSDGRTFSGNISIKI